jgi:predicted nucleic acid-binding protein
VKRLFLDASVLYAAIRSSRGHARELVMRGVRREIGLVTSAVVLAETRRNRYAAEPLLLMLFDRFTTEVRFEYIRPTTREIRAAAKRVNLKDAPIVAAARKAKVDMLVTFDRRHLLGKPLIARYVRAPIGTARQAMDLLTETNA